MRASPSPDTPVGRELPRNFGVYVIEPESKGGWAAIARDGERLGFVPADAVERIQ